MPRITSNGITLAYDEAGSGPPVVFVHGGGLDRRMWRPQLAVFGERFHAVAYDMRGQGESDCPETGYGQDVDAADLIGLIDARGFDQVALVGLSLGSAVAQRVAFDHPDRITKLVVAGGLGTPTVPDPVFTAHVARIRDTWERTGDPAAVWRMNVDGPIIAISKPYANWPLVKEIMLNQPGTRLSDPNRGALPSVDIAAHVADLAMPVLSVVGANDLDGIQARGRYLVSVLPGARHVVIPDAGHLVNMDAPEAFNRIVLDFLTTPR